MQNYVDWQFLKHSELAGWFRDSYTYSVHGNLSGGRSFVDLVWPAVIRLYWTHGLWFFSTTILNPFFFELALTPLVLVNFSSLKQVYEITAYKVWRLILVHSLRGVSHISWILLPLDLLCYTEARSQGKGKTIHFKKPKRGRRKGWSMCKVCPPVTWKYLTRP